MKKQCFIIPVIIIFTVGLSSQAYSQMISNLDPLSKYKGVLIELKDGTVVKGVNATLYADSLNFSKYKSYQKNHSPVTSKIFYIKKSSQRSPLSQIKSLKYSNTHYGNSGAFLGFLGGVGITVISLSENGSNNDYGPDPIFLITPLATTIGYVIGSNFYTDWQDYVPSRFDAGKPTMTMNIQNKTFMVGYKIPLR